MKSLLITILILFITLGSSAQDIIIKSNGDTLDCKILKVLNNSVQFRVAGSDNEFEILRAEVSEIIKGEEVKKIKEKIAETEIERLKKEEEEFRKQQEEIRMAEEKIIEHF